MTIQTTCIGAYPKPDFVRLPDWFNHPDGPDTADPTALWEKAMAELGPDASDIIARGVANGASVERRAGVGEEGEVRIGGLPGDSAWRVHLVAALLALKHDNVRKPHDISLNSSRPDRRSPA